MAAVRIGKGKNRVNVHVTKGRHSLKKGAAVGAVAALAAYPLFPVGWASGAAIGAGVQAYRNRNH